MNRETIRRAIDARMAQLELIVGQVADDRAGGYGQIDRLTADLDALCRFYRMGALAFSLGPPIPLLRQETRAARLLRVGRELAFARRDWLATVRGGAARG
jgi:hypothetical protein